MSRMPSLALCFLVACVVQAQISSDAPEASVTRSAVTWRAPVTRQWRPFVQFESLTPSLSAIGPPSVVAETRIPFAGGPLQNYMNVNFASLAGRLYDPVAPFGGTAVMSVAQGRAEIYGGAAGVFVPFATPYSHPNAWLTQASAGFRVRLDSGSHVWVGTTAYYLTDFADKKRQWATGTADLTIRFGR